MTDKTEITLDTLSGIKILKLHVEGKTVTAVTVDMGSPLETGEVHFEDKYPFRSTRVSMGNPHLVTFVDDITQINLPEIGPESMGKRFGNYSSLWDRCLCYRSSSLHQRAYRKKKRYNNGRWYSHH